MAHHVVAGIERRGDAMRRAFHYADAETRDVARHHTDARADGLSRDRAGMIRTGVAAGTAGEQQTTRQRSKHGGDETIRFHSLFVFERLALVQPP